MTKPGMSAARRRWMFDGQQRDDLLVRFSLLSIQHPAMQIPDLLSATVH
jgi:hypothetical protein